MDPGDSSAGQGFETRLADGLAIPDKGEFDTEGSDSAHGLERKGSASDVLVDTMD
jgi:hypothetical protein